MPTRGLASKRYWQPKTTMKIAEIIEKYISADSQSRMRIEQEVGQSQTTLSSMLGFMSECAVLAVRQKDKSFIEHGLYANIVEGCRQDFRDNIVQLTKLYHSCLILDLDPDNIFQSIADKAKGEGKDLIISFYNREPVDKTLKCMGIKTTLTPQFDYIQIDWNDNYFKETEYSETTDKKIIAATNKP
ncbi:MAG: hypothetical protein H6Q25_713 [Bacteroidetes bacterium]|nr:hypothetical protein [Bacteroidota bacterium]